MGSGGEQQEEEAPRLRAPELESDSEDEFADEVAQQEEGEGAEAPLDLSMEELRRIVDEELGDEIVRRLLPRCRSFLRSPNAVEAYCHS